MNLQSGDIFIIGFAIVNALLITFSGSLSQAFIQANHWYLRKFKSKIQKLEHNGFSGISSDFKITKHQARLALILGGTLNLVGLAFFRFWFMPFLEK